ncbi:CsgE family curli-type amyloid fiber assembly protein [Altibacter sp. HG106]|uniref:CsgE family curli-type amyloid fiber assembly protein n=1 Tax=Altibacter sp. HG106 TaxID=3023937 RepID=UPI00234FC35F|nr:CsgE family curli-type amyloid fiber assembly protein [Altibacter sp. HG106]MDC7995803.1 CsgE family curli-type amyloid fiber assembly protein [Altibacter sp. HG106]
MKALSYIGQAFLLLFSISVFSQGINSDIEAKIFQESNGEFITIKAFGINKTITNYSLRFVLTITDKAVDEAAATPEKEEGRFILDPNERKELASVFRNVDPQQRTIILLLIYDQDDQIVGKDRIVLNGPENVDPTKLIIDAKNAVSEDLNNAGEDGYVPLTGIVTEDTKTKPGRDFYYLYKRKYDKEEINGEMIVAIKEVLALGINTKIQVLVEGELIFEFFVNPRAGYLDQMVAAAIERTNRYFQYIRSRGDNYVKRY